MPNTSISLWGNNKEKVVFIMKFAMDINFDENRFLMFVLDQVANDYEEKGIDVIRMTLGKSELPLRKEIIEAIQDAIADFSKSALVYPSGLPLLRTKLAEYYSKKYAIGVDSKNVIVSYGTSSIFRNLFQLLLGEDDEVLLPFPYYSLYHFSALLTKAKIKYYKIDTETLKLDRQSFMDNFTDKTKLVVLNSPGNPLGNIIERNELEFIDKTVNGQAVIISDEIYSNICFEDGFTSCLQLVNPRSQFILTSAFSKGYRMYSRRVGYCIVPDEFINPLTVMQHHTLLTTDPVAQFGACKALEYESEVEELRNIYMERRNYTIEQFKNVSLVRAIPAKGSFYFTLDCKEFMKEKCIHTSEELALDIIHKIKVATVPGSDFLLPETLRLSYSTNRYMEGIDRLVAYFNS